MVNYEEERSKYVNCFASRRDKDELTNIDRWIQFAAAKGVSRLEFNFSDEFVIHPRRQTRHLSEAERCYTSPTPITELMKLGRDLKQLASLRLRSVGLADEHVPCFLHNCPQLEELSIVHAPSLSDVKVVAAKVSHALRLKHLEIRECKGLQHLEVFASF